VIAFGVEGRMKRLFLACAGLSVLLSGCGAYLHDASLVAPATTANARLTQATTLAPFDDQLVKLEAFAREEDLAVASWWTAQRDSKLAGLIAQPDWATEIAASANRRLTILAPRLDMTSDAIVRSQNRTGARQEDRQDLAHEERVIARFQIAWAVVAPGDPRKTDCASLRAEISEAGAAALAMGATDREKALGYLVGSCWGAETYRARLADLDAALANAGGTLAEANAALLAAQRPLGSDLSAEAQALADAVKAAEAAAELGTAKSLADFEKKLSDVLKPLSQAAQLAGWDHAGKEIDQLLRARVCASGAGIDEALRTEAECGALVATTTVGREAALWAFARAAAQAADANRPNSKSVQWLIAAKAIIAAEKTDAQLSLDLAAKQAAVETQRVDALLREAIALKEAIAATTAVADPLRTQAVGCFGVPEACALAVYAEAWNAGRIPAEVLRYRTVQLDREYAVRRARVVAGRYRALALAGTASLQAYGEGGITPETLAQLFFDLTLLGVVSE
jgi:hypothetical protein